MYYNRLLGSDCVQTHPINRLSCVVIRVQFYLLVAVGNIHPDM